MLYLILYETKTNHLPKPQKKRFWKKLRASRDELAIKKANKNMGASTKVAHILKISKTPVVIGIT